MLNDLDETIKALLKDVGELGGREFPDVNISFDIPRREWATDIGITPTINCYLFDIHERRQLREEGWRIEERGAREPKRLPPPLFFEMTYLITAWTKDVEAEHKLLWRVLETLMDFPVLPKQYLQGKLAEHKWPVSTTVGQLEGVLKSPGEFWTALENQLKPSLAYVVTLGRQRNPFPTEPAFAPPVLSTGIRVQLPEATAEEGFLITELFKLPLKGALQGIVVTVEGQDAQAVTDVEGRFQLRNLSPGRHVLVAEIHGKTYRRAVVIRAPRGYRDVVVDQDNQPLAGVEVQVEGTNARAVTDAQGRFTLDLTPGSYTLRVLMDGWTERRAIIVREPGYLLRLHVGGAPREPSKRAED